MPINGLRRSNAKSQIQLNELFKYMWTYPVTFHLCNVLVVQLCIVYLHTREIPPVNDETRSWCGGNEDVKMDVWSRLHNEKQTN